jgi:hypothetical protein
LFSPSSHVASRELFCIDIVIVLRSVKDKGGDAAIAGVAHERYKEEEMRMNVLVRWGGFFFQAHGPQAQWLQRWA